MKKLSYLLTALVILSFALGTFSCGGGEKGVTGGEGASDGGTSGGGAGETGCCMRDLASLPPEMPAGQERDLGSWLAGAVDSQLVRSTARTKCPLILAFLDVENREFLNELVEAMSEAAGAEPDPEAQAILAQYLDLDYLFVGQITVDEQTGFRPQGEGGDIEGRFTYKLQLVDHHRGAVVKEGQTSWSDTLFYGVEPIKELSKSFEPLDQLIRDYERLPEEATLEPGKDPVNCGEQMTIHVKDILDYKKRPSQPWQWIVVKADKGEILNGRKQDDGTYAFEVGSGSVDIKYKAPQNCDGEECTDTIWVYNTCNNDIRVTGNFLPEREIASSTFDIECEPGWLLELTYTEDKEHHAAEEDYSDDMHRALSFTLRAALKPAGSAVRNWMYEVAHWRAEEAYVEYQDNFSDERRLNSHSGSEGWRADYDGNVSVQINLEASTETGSSTGQSFVLFLSSEETMPYEWYQGKCKGTYENPDWGGLGRAGSGVQGEGIATLGIFDPNQNVLTFDYSYSFSEGDESMGDFYGMWGSAVSIDFTCENDDRWIEVPQYGSTTYHVEWTLTKLGG